jgi:uncharacterized membrane protein
MEYSVTTTVAAPATTVWTILQDVEGWPTFTKSVTSVRWKDGGTMTVGCKARVKQPRFPTATWTVTEVVPGRSFTWVSPAVGLHSTGFHEVEPGPDGTIVTLAIRQRGPLHRVMWWFTGSRSKRYVDMEAAGLKAKAEAAATVNG